MYIKTAEGLQGEGRYAREEILDILEIRGGVYDPTQFNKFVVLDNKVYIWVPVNESGEEPSTDDPPHHFEVARALGARLGEDDLLMGDYSPGQVPEVTSEWRGLHLSVDPDAEVIEALYRAFAGVEGVSWNKLFYSFKDFESREGALKIKAPDSYENESPFRVFLAESFHPRRIVKSSLMKSASETILYKGMSRALGEEGGLPLPNDMDNLFVTNSFETASYYGEFGSDDPYVLAFKLKDELNILDIRDEDAVRKMLEEAVERSSEALQDAYEFPVDPDSPDEIEALVEEIAVSGEDVDRDISDMGIMDSYWFALMVYEAGYAGAFDGESYAFQTDDPQEVFVALPEDERYFEPYTREPMTRG